jgi:ribonucleotide monophosphatase NagD (HAD superfamily)
VSKELTEEVIAFLVDLDGVLYEDNRLIPGAVEAIVVTP